MLLWPKNLSRFAISILVNELLPQEDRLAEQSFCSLVILDLLVFFILYNLKILVAVPERVDPQGIPGT